MFIFSVWVSLCPCLSLLPNRGRYLADKLSFGLWQNVNGILEYGYVVCICFCPERAYLPVPTENIRITLKLYGKVVLDYNPWHWYSTWLTFNLYTPLIFLKKLLFLCNNPLQHNVLKMNVAAFLWLLYLASFCFPNPSLIVQGNLVKCKWGQTECNCCCVMISREN